MNWAKDPASFAYDIWPLSRKTLLAAKVPSILPYPIVNNQTAQHQDFPPTQWTVVLSARAEDSEERSQALQQICQTYWHPIYAYARKRGFSPTDAEDVTQEFFVYLLGREEFANVRETKGKLRTFLLVAARNFMANELQKRKAQKRGGGVTVLSIDVTDAEEHTCLEPADSLTPEAVFERHWASSILNTVMQRLRESYELDGKSEVFEALKDHLGLGRGERSYREIGEELGMSEMAARLTVHRMRKRYRQFLLQQVASTLDPEESAEEELRYLFGVFQS
jgi:RNA polymerase sigma factor (sigma-70 family)